MQVSGHSCDEASKDLSLIESFCNAIRDIDIAKDLINIHRNQHLGYWELRNIACRLEREKCNVMG